MSLKVKSFKVNQQGSMLISVLFILVIMGGLMAALTTVSNQSAQQLVYEVQAFKARISAEAMLEEQVFYTLGDIETSAIAKHDAPREYRGCQGYIEDIKVSEHQPKQVNITATGTCRTGHMTVLRNIEVEVIDEN